MVPLAFRALARGVANSPLSGTGYCALLLGRTGEEVRVRAQVQRTEAIGEIDGQARVTSMTWTLVQEAVVARTEARVVQAGDLFRDDEGKTWEIRDPFRNGAGQWRITLVEPQDVPKPPADPSRRPRRPPPR